jgi:hypothetical protein
VDRGRGHTYLLDGEKIDGVTTLLSNGLPKPQLTNWAARSVAEHCFANRSEMASWDERRYVDDAKSAPWRDRDAAARRGTEVHAIAEQIASGKTVDVPEELQGHVDQYMQFLDDHNPTYAALERSVFSRTHRYAGTFDAVAHIDSMGDGNTLLDLKTSRSGPFGEVALQLAAYRWAEFWLDDKAAEHPMAELDIRQCAVLWVTNDSYELRPVESDETVHRTFLYVATVARAARTLTDLLGPPALHLEVVS